MPQKYVIPQAIRFGVLSWKKGTRQAGWVARGFELGARGWVARGLLDGGQETGWVACGSELGARNNG